MSTINDCRIIDLSKIHNKAGNITVIEHDDLIPFSVKRIYYLYDVPGGTERGGHAHKRLYQLIVAASGSFNIQLDDGNLKKAITLNHPYKGLIVMPGIWRDLVNFSSGSICLVLASDLFDDRDYLRNYNYYLKYKNDSSTI